MAILDLGTRNISSIGLVILATNSLDLLIFVNLYFRYPGGGQRQLIQVTDEKYLSTRLNNIDSKDCLGPPYVLQ